MSLSAPAFLGVWGTATLFWLGLLYQYHSKWGEVLEECATNIRSYNARNGYDLSIDREELARDFLYPFHNQDIKDFAENNGISADLYRKELDEAIPKPHLRWAFLFHILGLIYTFSGISYLTPIGFLSPVQFLYSVVVWFLVSLVLYLSL